MKNFYLYLIVAAILLGVILAPFIPVKAEYLPGSVFLSWLSKVGAFAVCSFFCLLILWAVGNTVYFRFFDKGDGK